MGCGSSMDTNSVHDDRTGGLGQDLIPIVQEFVRIDEQISQIESLCPGPRMATVEAWVEHIKGKRNEFLSVDGYAMAEVLNGDQIHQITLGPSDMQENSTTADDIQILTLNDNEPKATNPNPSTSGVNGFLPQGNGMRNGKIFAGRSKGAATNATNSDDATRHNNDLVASTPNKDLASLALNLGVISDVNKASTHEDFFANLSESTLYLITVRYYTVILEHSKVRLKKLVDEYAKLNEKYLKQDGIIAYISGGTYMSRLEENIDAQLEVARDVRDKLGSTMEQWRICGMLLRACANSATLSLQQWRHLAKLRISKEKIQTALECRSTLQASLISLECAQLALPQVAIKYVSQRQILAVRHCNTYMITDVANMARYEHTSKVFASYESNMSKASTWLYDTFNITLRKDFDKAEDAVQKLAKNLRDHREEIFPTARS